MNLKDGDILLAFLRGTNLLYFQNLLIDYEPPFYYWMEYLKANQN